jgi:hypothetical protein
MGLFSSVGFDPISSVENAELDIPLTILVLYAGVDTMGCMMFDEDDGDTNAKGSGGGVGGIGGG